MNNKITINHQVVSFKLTEKKVFVSSLDIAKIFEKQHKNVLAQIEALPQDNFNGLNFKPVTYKDAKGEFRPAYHLTRDGFSLLVMGFTGARAYQWKIAFINAFNQMESLLKNKETPAIPQNYAEALRMLADSFEENISLKTKIKDDKPFIDFAYQITESEGCISIGDFAKILCKKGLDIGEKRLFKFLRNKGFLTNKNTPYQRFLEAGYFRVVEKTIPNLLSRELYAQTLITGKGQLVVSNAMMEEKKALNLLKNNINTGVRNE